MVRASWVSVLVALGCGLAACGNDEKQTAANNATGGANTTGGNSAFSGAATTTNANPLQGGTSAAGGTSAVGGTPATGGAIATGGTHATGGAAPGAGGSSSMSTGGSSHASTGGASTSGGAARATGGSSGCGGSTSMGQVSPAQLSAELVQSPRTFLLINVHIPVSGHIPGTDADVAYNNVPAIEQFIGTDKSKSAVIYCMTDSMSSEAGPKLVADGYCNIRQLTGGLSAWRSAGYTVDP